MRSVAKRLLGWKENGGGRKETRKKLNKAQRGEKTATVLSFCSFQIK
jgi:hypothetical protein